jgi:prepilin-type N-terminal cleavage/methylation domain-containing protein
VRKCCRNKKAFTLIELLATIVVVGIVAVPLSMLIAGHIESVFVSEDEVMARQFARLELEKVNNMPFANIASLITPAYEGYNYTVYRVVSFAQGNNASAENLKKITVNVTKTNSATALISLVTYLAKNVIYGL